MVAAPVTMRGDAAFPVNAVEISSLRNRWSRSDTTDLRYPMEAGPCGEDLRAGVQLGEARRDLHSRPRSEPFPSSQVESPSECLEGTYAALSSHKSRLLAPTKASLAKARSRSSAAEGSTKGSRGTEKGVLPRRDSMSTLSAPGSADVRVKVRTGPRQEKDCRTSLPSRMGSGVGVSCTNNSERMQAREKVITAKRVRSKPLALPAAPTPTGGQTIESETGVLQSWKRRLETEASKLAGLTAAKKFSENVRLANRKATRNAPQDRLDQSELAAKVVPKQRKAAGISSHLDRVQGWKLEQAVRGEPLHSNVGDSLLSRSSFRSSFHLVSHAPVKSAASPLTSSTEFNTDKKGKVDGMPLKAQPKAAEIVQEVVREAPAKILRVGSEEQENIETGHCLELSVAVLEEAVADRSQCNVHTESMTLSTKSSGAELEQRSTGAHVMGGSFPFQGTRIPFWPAAPASHARKDESIPQHEDLPTLVSAHFETPAEKVVAKWHSRSERDRAAGSDGDSSPVSTLDLRLVEDSLSPTSTMSRSEGDAGEVVDPELESDGEADKSEPVFLKSVSQASSADTAESLEFASLGFIGEIEGMEQDLEYVRHVLVTSGFGGEDIPQWYSEELPIDPAVFEELEIGLNFGSGSGISNLDSVRRAEERRQRMLLFDAVNEALGWRLTPFLDTPPWVKTKQPVLRPRPVGKALLQEVWEEIHDWPVPVSEEVYDILDDAARRDMTRGQDKWDDCAEEESRVLFEIEAAILQGLLEEVVDSFSAVERERTHSCKVPLVSVL